MTTQWQGMITFLGTASLKKTDEFYCSILGFKVFMDQGVCKIYEIPGGGMIGFCTHIEPEMGERSPLLTFVTDEVDDVYNKFLAHGITPEAKPKQNEKFPVYHFFVKDFDGYKVEIQKFTNL